MYIQSQSVTFTLLWTLKGWTFHQTEAFFHIVWFLWWCIHVLEQFHILYRNTRGWYFLCCVTGNSSMHLTACWLWECCCSSVQLQTFIHTLSSNSVRTANVVPKNVLARWDVAAARVSCTKSLHAFIRLCKTTLMTSDCYVFIFLKLDFICRIFLGLFRPLHHPTSPPKNLNTLNTTCLSNKLHY